MLQLWQEASPTIQVGETLYDRIKRIPQDRTVTDKSMH